MGARNVAAVLLTWTDLPHRARTVLTAMAVVSHDQDSPTVPARRYFGGVGYLAEVLYGADAIERDQQTGAAVLADNGEFVPTASARRQVEKVLTELVRAGAVKRVVDGRRGKRAVYEVLLTRLGSPTISVGLLAVDDGSSDAVSPTDSVGSSPTESVGSTRPIRSHSPTESVGPRRHEEPRGERGGTTSPQVTTSPAAAEREAIEWSDVPLFTVGTEGYAEANMFLERTLGTARAGQVVAHLIASGCPSPTDAVVTAAWRAGWEPTTPDLVQRLREEQAS